MKVGLLAALETPGGRIDRIARQLLAWGRLIPSEEIVGKIDAVTIEECASGRAGSPRRRAHGRGDRPDQGPARDRPHRRALCGAERPRAVHIPAVNQTMTTTGASPSRLALRLAGRYDKLPDVGPDERHRALRIVSFAIALLLAALAVLACPRPAGAVEAVRVNINAPAIDLTPMVERYRSNGDEIRISTAPGRDGIVRRIAVKAREAGTRPDWIVFALTNDSDEQVDRLLVAPHFRLTASGVIWPDLGSSRIAAITASQGIRPEREDSPDADAFLITLDPGTTVTFVAELSIAEPAAGLSVGGRRLQGTGQRPDALQGHHHRHRRPAGAVPDHRLRRQGRADLPGRGGARLGGAGLFLHRFRLLPAQSSRSREAAERIYRAGAEAVLAATLLVFLFAYLNLNRWHVRYSHVAAFWLVFLGALVGLAVVDPPVASGVARISIAAVAAIGFVLVHPSCDARLRPRRDAGADLAPPDRLGDRRRLHRHGAADERPRAAGADRRPRAHRHADRLHGDAARLRGRRLRAGPDRATPNAGHWRSAGAGDIVFDWDVVSDRIYRQPGGRTAARPQARLPRRPGLRLARPDPSRSTGTATAPPSTP